MYMLTLLVLDSPQRHGYRRYKDDATAKAVIDERQRTDTCDPAFTAASASGSTVSGPLDGPTWTRADLVDQRGHVPAQPAPLARTPWLWRDLLCAVTTSLMNMATRQGAPCRDQAAERTLRSLMMASANAQARIGALAEMYSREGRERTPEESAEMLALMRAQRERARQMNALADQYSWDVDMVSRLLAEPPRP